MRAAADHDSNHCTDGHGHSDNVVWLDALHQVSRTDNATVHHGGRGREVGGGHVARERARDMGCGHPLMALPLTRGTRGGSAEIIVDGDGRALGEAAISAQTQHVLLPPLDAPCDAPPPPHAEARGRGKRRWRRVASAIKAASVLGSSSDDALLTSDMLMDYLEQVLRPCTFDPAGESARAREREAYLEQVLRPCTLDPASYPKP
jgi:hypothetical protein